MPARTFTLVGGIATLRAMNTPAHGRPVHVIRWRNFRRLLDEKELTITRAGELLDRTQGFVSHFGGKRPIKIIGDELAAHIETTFSLPAGYLDVEGGSVAPFSYEDDPSHNRDVRQSYAARLDMLILAEAVKIVDIDTQLNGSYPYPKRAALLVHLYDQLDAGEEPLALIAKLTQQRSQSGGTDAAEAPGRRTAQQ